MPRWPKKDADASATDTTQQDIVFPAPQLPAAPEKKQKAQLTFAPKPWVKRFLKYLAQSGNVSWSAEKAHVRAGAAQLERRNNPVFAAQWAEAMEASLSVLEVEARRRAVEGTLVPVYSKAKQIGTIRKHSDQLLMFLLKAAKPEVYRDNVSIEHNMGERTLSTAAALISAMRSSADNHGGTPAEVAEQYVDVLVNNPEEDNS